MAVTRLDVASQPCASMSARARMKKSLDSSFVNSLGKNLITSSSAFIAANGSKSSSFH